MIIYDCEIIRAIPPKDGNRLEDIEYCEGWDDHAGMGISVIGVYDYASDRYRVFCKDNFDEFQALVDSADLIVGYNSLKFDNQLCAANSLKVPNEKSYDLLVEIWEAHGLASVFQYPSHVGYSLDAVAQANFGDSKTGNGAMAPVLWQQGKIGQVIDYCLQDVRLTKRLMDQVINTEKLISPLTGKEVEVQAWSNDRKSKITERSYGNT